MITEADMMPNVDGGYLTDLSWIVPLDRMCFRHCAWSRRHFRQELVRRGVRLAVVRRRAYVLYRKWGSKFEVIGVAVHPRYRRRGLGRMLMRHVIDQALLVDGSRVFLEVNCANENAIRMYEELGFVIIGRIKGYYGRSEHAFEMMREMD